MVTAQLRGFWLICEHSFVTRTTMICWFEQSRADASRCCTYTDDTQAGKHDVETLAGMQARKIMCDAASTCKPIGNSQPSCTRPSSSCYRFRPTTHVKTCSNNIANRHCIGLCHGKGMGNCPCHVLSIVYHLSRGQQQGCSPELAR